jgi:hypothetical protein
MSQSAVAGRRRCLAAAIAVAGAVGLAGTGSAAAATPLQFTSVVDAPYANTEAEPDRHAAVIGDFNGDGIDDHAYATGKELRVVFGARGDADGGGSVQFTGTAGQYVVDGAGDVDRDGFDDVVVGQTSPAGAAFVIYGAASTPASMVLAAGPRITAIATGSPTHVTVDGLGDFNGDGFDDVAVSQTTGSAVTLNISASQAIVLGGPRVAQLSALAVGPRVSLIKAPTRCAYYFFLPFCNSVMPELSAVGDFDADGKADVAIDTLAAGGRRIVLGRTGTAAISAPAPGAGSIDLTARLAATQAGEPWSLRRIFAAGDVNGDGASDLAVPIFRGTNMLPQYAILLGRRTPAAAFSASEPVITLGQGNDVPFLSAAGDQDGDGRGDLLIGRGQVFRVVSVPAGATSVDVAAAPRIVVPGTITETDGPADLDGDGAPDLIGAGRESVGLFTHGVGLPTNPKPECVPVVTPNRFRYSQGATVSVAPCTNTALVVDYWSPTKHVAQRYPVLTNGATSFPFSTDIPPSWLQPGTYTISVAPENGLPRSSTFEILPETEAPAGQLPTVMNDPKWSRSGSAAVVGTATVLTSGPAQAASTVWLSPIDPNGKSFEFRTTLSGGTGQAEGVTMAFLRGDAPIPAGGLLGGGLGKLGFGGLDGVALALDVNKQPTDPAASFIGLADGERGESLNYLQTADPGVRLRGAQVLVKLVSKDGVVSVYVNNRLRLTRTMTLPSPARLAFTGSTGATIWQTQSINTIAVTTS